MINNLICVPIHTLNGELIALDFTQINYPLKKHVPEMGQIAESRLLNQLLTIEQYADYFRLHNLLCCVTINFQLAKAVIESVLIQRILSHLPFVRLKLSEDFPNLHDGPNNPILRTLVEQLNVLWLDDLGAGAANLNALQSKMFEAVKLDRQFYLKNVGKPFFNVLMKHIRQYTHRVIVEGVENNLGLDKLADNKIWGVQGYYLPVVPFSDLSDISPQKHP
ncbi:EAL domain-containing protein [Erwinia psidii]|uniref:EAL domain-containing protein n=1 Tax=Erwinia psidii TaxID=69224 RepID=A0A3N6RZD8_9GAMM|nr:EAL domain-containing protein [Erwinia psidii]MCX8955860.1 EAL domain-containing protein [Erwinia psidii]MCX8961231.1 EAL domain-containing protein [Erwinia psidii]MCX8966408.1 EAL domain-containing protein [Erwinia psidii]RQM38578.1 EAL domain-containing protein [Erwinia psidii]